MTLTQNYIFVQNLIPKLKFAPIFMKFGAHNKSNMYYYKYNTC